MTGKARNQYSLNEKQSINTTNRQREMNRGWMDPNYFSSGNPGGNGQMGYHGYGGGGGNLGGTSNNWIGSWKNFVEHERSTGSSPIMIQNALKIGLAEGLIVELRRDWYDFGGLQNIPNFGGADCGWTQELNLGRMRWEYELDARDLGAGWTLETEKKRNRAGRK